MKPEKPEKPVNLGVFTGCLPQRSLADTVGWAADNRFDALELGAWPAGTTREGTSCHVDVVNLDADRAAEISALVARRGLAISALAYYENNLHADERERERIHDHVRACVDAAALLGVRLVNTFVGRHIGLTVRENIELAGKVLRPLVQYAADQGVQLACENCPMEGWHPDGYPANLAYSPELWEPLFRLGFELNYDPSHLVWLGIDPIKAIRDYGDHILHVQAKDVEILPDGRHRHGIFGATIERKSVWDAGWWRYRLPGLGQIDWVRLVDVLYEVGYEGTIAIEHEDPVWGGSQERIEQGLLIAHRTLRPLIIA